MCLEKKLRNSIKSIEKTNIDTHVISTIKVIPLKGKAYYETAIWKLPENEEGAVVVVAKYETKRDAILGHKLQVENCKRIRPTTAWDIDLKRNVKL